MRIWYKGWLFYQLVECLIEFRSFSYEYLCYYAVRINNYFCGITLYGIKYGRVKVCWKIGRYVELYPRHIILFKSVEPVLLITGNADEFAFISKFGILRIMWLKHCIKCGLCENIAWFYMLKCEKCMPKQCVLCEIRL